jgi:hypothetical protein
MEASRRRPRNPFTVALFGAGAARIRADVVLSWKRRAATVPAWKRPSSPAILRGVSSRCAASHRAWNPVEHLAGVCTDFVFSGKTTYYIWAHL